MVDLGILTDSHICILSCRLYFSSNYIFLIIFDEHIKYIKALVWEHLILSKFLFRFWVLLLVFSNSEVRVFECKSQMTFLFIFISENLKKKSKLLNWAAFQVKLHLSFNILNRFFSALGFFFIGESDRLCRQHIRQIFFTELLPLVRRRRKADFPGIAKTNSHSFLSVVE